MFNTLKSKIVLAVIAVGLALIAIFARGLSSPSQVTNPPSEQQNQTGGDVSVLSTKPSPLDHATVLPNQSIEMTFNYPLENVGEFKIEISPEVELSVELSNDRKTAKITPKKGFELGKEYRFRVKPDTKFEGKGALNHDINYTFTTINYTGV